MHAVEGTFVVNERFCLASFRVQELCESGGGPPGLPAPNSPYGLCGRKAILEEDLGSELPCESGGGRPGLPVPNSVYGLRGRRATLNLNWTSSA